MSLKLALYMAALVLFVIPIIWENEEYKNIVVDGRTVRKIMYWTVAFTIAFITFTFTILM